MPLSELRATVRFQSTLPVGGATWVFSLTGFTIVISIHAPRGGSDPGHILFMQGITDFNPRSPWGERPPVDGSTITNIWISIHAPRGGSDFLKRVRKYFSGTISIHAPRGGSDHRRQKS